MPFKIAGFKWAQARRPSTDPRSPKPVLLSGRAVHVWLHGVIVPIACGLAPEGVEIRKSHDSPWHLIDYTPDEAYALLVEHYPMQRGLRQKVDAHRKRNGLVAA